MAGRTVCGANPARKRGAHGSGEMRSEPPQTPLQSTGSPFPSRIPFFGKIPSILSRFPPVA